MRTVLITGFSGVGKSTVLQKLASEDVLCIDLDDGWMQEIEGEWMINLERVKQFMHAHPGVPIVIAGCAMNQRELHADCTVLLTASVQTMRARIAERENPFGKDEATWQKILADKQEFESRLEGGSDIVINTDQPLEETLRVIKQLL